MVNHHPVKNQSKGSNKSKFEINNSEILAEKPLHEICKKYYRESYKKYNEFFLNCVEEIEALQPNGFSCVQVLRYFVVGILPQYCVIPDPLTKKQRERVEKILAS